MNIYGDDGEVWDEVDEHTFEPYNHPQVNMRKFCRFPLADGPCGYLERHHEKDR
jgi:hypothetical protein